MLALGTDSQIASERMTGTDVRLELARIEAKTQALAIRDESAKLQKALEKADVQSASAVASSLGLLDATNGKPKPRVPESVSSLMGAETGQIALWSFSPDVQGNRTAAGLDTATPSMHVAPIHRCIRAALACKARHHYHAVQAVYVLATLALALDLNALVLMMLAKVKAVPKSKCWQAGLCLCKEQNMLSMMRGKLTQFLPASFAPEKAKYKSAIGVLLCPA